MKKKTIAALLSCSLVIGAVIGGSLAWLTATDDPVVNTFTPSDISIILNEAPLTTEGTLDTTADRVQQNDTYKMVPAFAMPKDPKVTVEKDSEDCWLFVEVTESTDPVFSKYIAYKVNETTPTTQGADGVIHGGWTKGDGTDIPSNVYYRKVTKSTTADQEFFILGGGTYPHDGVHYSWENNEVLTKPEVTKADMTAVASNKPILTFNAYASQLYKTNSDGNPDTTTDEFTAAEAWANVPKN